MSRKDFADELRVEVWADSWPIFQVFAFDLPTQWRVGLGGQTGIDYNVLPFIFRMRGFPRSDWPRLFDDIRTMEGAAISEMHGDQTMSEQQTALIVEDVD